MHASMTLEEKVLAHLFARKAFDGEDHAKTGALPKELTQPGIAEMTFTKVKHISRPLNLLVKKGYVKKRKGHVENSKQWKYVYSLTQRGAYEAVYSTESGCHFLTSRVILRSVMWPLL